MLNTAPVDSSTFLMGRVKAVSTFLKYREQNVKHSSAKYPSAIQPFGQALLFRTYDFNYDKYLCE